MDRRYNRPNDSSYAQYSYSDCADEYPPPRYEPSKANQRAREEGQENTDTGEDRSKGAMSWMQRVTGSREFQFGATALISGAVVAGAILGYQHVRRQEMVEDLKSSIPALGEGHVADKVCPPLFSESASGY